MLLMVAEMTQNLALIPPAMLALMVSGLIMGERTIYRSQLGTRRDDPAGHRAPKLLSSALPYQPGGERP